MNLPPTGSCNLPSAKKNNSEKTIQLEQDKIESDVNVINGYLLKDTDKTEFVKALRQVHSGAKYFSGAVSNVLANRLLGSKTYTTKSSVEEDEYHLTKREKEILRMVIDGKHNKDIADASGKSVRTIETHRFNIMKKLGVNNAIDMVNKAIKENLV